MTPAYRYRAVLDLERQSEIAALEDAVAVSRLLQGCRPTNIARFVVAVIVGIAVDGMTLSRAGAHVCQKCWKGSAPTGANPNASTAVSLEIPNLRVIAARQHSAPRNILASTRSAVGASMFFRYARCRIHFGTSATFRLSSFQRSRGSGDLLSAVASTQPILRASCNSGWSIDATDHGKAAESLTRQVDKARVACWHHAILA